jgi:hypothetical protein
MTVIGCDFPSRAQQIAMPETGEVVERLVGRESGR